MNRPATFLVLALTGVIAGPALQAQDDEQVNSPNAIREQKGKHRDDVVKVLSTLGTRETVYDYLTFGISGPVVVLQGFTINGALRDNAKAQVEKLDWVTHVVQQVELLPVGPEVKRVRRETLGILKKQVPQAFPTGHANIRIGVNGDGVVTLIGIIRPNDETRYLAAVERVKHITFVASVEDKVVKQTS
jgi:osmotically-inducible protein OsmY